MNDQKTTLDIDYLDCRCMVLELAAAMDRLDRATAGNTPDNRLRTLRDAIAILASSSGAPDRAQRMLKMMSDPLTPVSE
jgi:hypothetical protein